MNIALTTTGFAVTQRVSRCEAAALACAGIAVALGVSVLCGWLLSIGALKNIQPSWAAMQPGSAFCMVVAGVSLFAAGQRSTRGASMLRQGAAMIVLGFSLLTLLQYLLNIDIGADQIFRASAAQADGRLGPGRMAAATATNFLLIAVALAALESRARLFTQLLALSAMGIAMLAILGYVYGVDALYGIGFFSTIALHTAIGNLVLGLGALLSRPERGVVAILVSDWAGGAMARRLLPLALIAPLLIGWVGIEGERLHQFEPRFGVALTAVAYMILFCVFTWRVAQDLQRTEQLRSNAETIRHEQALQLDGLIESAMDAIVMLDENQSIIVFNPSAEIMFGHARAAVLGRSLEMLMPQRFRAGHGAQVSTFGGAGSTARRMGSLGAVTAIRADGAEFPVEASISISRSGQGICYTAIVRDITDRVHAEHALHASELRERMRAQELEKLLFAVPAAVCFAYDDPLVALNGNDVHTRWFGATPAPASAGSATPSGMIALQRAARGEELHNYEFRHESLDGSVRYLMGNATPLCDDDGSPCGAVSVFVDVTELKLAESAMISVVAGSVAKSNYITHMTHELRTPLNTILGYAQILDRAELAPPHQAAVRHIIKAGWHLRDLITEVQDLAVIEAHSAGLSSHTILVDGVIDDVCGMLKPLVAEAGLRVMLVGAAGLAIHANPVRLKQILLNLLSNAIKYNRAGGAIQISRETTDQFQVTIGVRDGGHGLSAIELAGLFQPFNRLGQELGKQVGTGVGLVVTKKLVESMGGSIGAESDATSGSFFWFRLPSALPALCIV